MALKVVNFEGKSVKEKQVPSTFSPKTVNQHLIWEIIKAEQANQRQGTHKTKVKSEVSGGGAKPWRQKGTGRARQGSTRNPQWRGGGISFGPLPRDYREAMPQRKKQNGIRHIIAEKILTEKVVLLDSVNLDKISTKSAFEAVKKIVAASPFATKIAEGRKLSKSSNDDRRQVTIITASEDEKGKKSFRNIPWVQFINVNRLAAQPLFYNHGMIITEEAFDVLTTKCEKAAGKK